MTLANFPAYSFEKDYIICDFRCKTQGSIFSHISGLSKYQTPILTFHALKTTHAEISQVAFRSTAQFLD